MRLTDMTNSSLMPQFIEEISNKVAEEKEKYILETLYRLDIDPDILINQMQEIRRLNNILEEYKDLEEQGLLLRLPCKVGDTIYEIVNGKIKEFCFYNTWRIARYLETGIFGEYAFLTREDAEAKLKEMEE